MVIVSEIYEGLFSGLSKDDSFSVVVKISRILACDDASSQVAVAGDESFQIFDQNDAPSGLDDGIVSKVEANAIVEVDATEINGLTGCVQEFDEFEFISIRGDGELGRGGWICRAVVDLRDD